MIRAKTVDEYILKAPDWAQPKLETIRRIALDCSLKEAIKWGGPAYLHKTNILGLGAFKNWVAVWFHQGAFLTDTGQKLVAAQDKTKGLRQWRFLPEEDLPEDLLKQYILEAVANDEKGLKITPHKNTSPLVIPEVLKEALNAKSSLFKLFSGMTKAQQREFCDYINEAKREDTKVRRVQKCINLISAKQGLNDKYKQ